MSYYSDDTYDVYCERRVMARTPHRCDACGETVAPRTTYWRVTLVFDRSAETVKRCERCQAIHLHLRTLGDYGVWPDERLNCGEEYEQHWGLAPPAEIAALAFALPSEVLAEDPDGP